MIESPKLWNSECCRATVRTCRLSSLAEVDIGSSTSIQEVRKNSGINRLGRLLPFYTVFMPPPYSGSFAMLLLFTNMGFLYLTRFVQFEVNCKTRLSCSRCIASGLTQNLQYIGPASPVSYLSPISPEDTMLYLDTHRTIFCAASGSIDTVRYKRT
jgi:hypothetical protein